MNKTIKNILILVAIGIIVGLAMVYYVFNKPHRDIEGEKPAYKVEAQKFFAEYSKDEIAGDEKYGDKVVEVTGKIVDITKEGKDISIVLNDEMEGINCALNIETIKNNKDRIDRLKVGDTVSLKGKCDGIDMIMGIVMTQCYIVDK